jgi:hypothetical protein
LENFDLYEKMLSEYASSTGSAMKENEIRLNSWESKLNQLSNSLGDFWNRTIDTDLIKGGISLLTELIDTFGNLGTILTYTGLILAAWKGKEFIAFLTNMNIGMKLNIASFPAYIMGLGTAQAATLGLEVTTTRAKIAMLGLGQVLKTNWFGILLGGITLTITAFNLYDKRQREIYENTINNAKAFTDEKQKIDKLVDSITDLANKEKLSVDEKNRMGQVQAELQKMYPDIFANLDLETMKYEDLASAVKLATDEKRREALQDIENEKTKLKAQINNVERETFSSGFAGIITPAKEKATASKIDNLKKKLAELNAISTEVILGGSSSNDIESGRLRYGSTTTKTTTPTSGSSSTNSNSSTPDLEVPYKSLYQTVKNLNYELDRQNEILSQTKDSDQIPILTERNKKLEQQKKNLQALNDARREELATLKPTSERYQELSDKIQETSLEWWKLDNAQLANIKTMDDIRDAAKELITKTLEEQTKNLEDVQKQMVDIIKKRYELELEEAEKASKKKQEKLDKELDKYKENIDKQIDAIDKLRDAEDFSDNQGKISSNISTLTNERNTLSMAAASGDLVAINRIKEIDKELAEERENLSDLQQDREDELRKQALQNSLDEKEQKIKYAKEAEDKKFEIIKSNYDKLLQEGNLYAEANKALTTGMVTDINGKLVTVQEAFTTFSNTFGETLGALGNNLQSEFVNKLKQAKSLLDSMDSINLNISGDIPQYACGTNDAIGGLSVVGENGAELVNLPKHSQVFPANITQKLIGGVGSIMPNFNALKIPSIAGVGGSGGVGSINISVPVNINGAINEDTGIDLGNTVARIIRQELNKGGIFRR